MSQPPLPPFTHDTALRKVRAAEDAWNSRDPNRVALAYTEDSQWRNRAEFLEGRDAIIAFLTRKWQAERDYRLVKGLWAFEGDRIAVRFAYEWHDESGDWHRPSSCGGEWRLATNSYRSRLAHEWQLSPAKATFAFNVNAGG